MPHVIVKVYPGRDEASKKKLAEAVAEQVAAAAPCDPTAVSVAIEEVAPDQWADRVYKPDILDKSDEIYVQPGYNPFET